MELIQLKYFQLLARRQHLTKTAQELHITPPALSVSIAKLEEELGVKLFDRTGRNIKLNACGSLMLRHVDQIFQSLQDAQRELRDMQGKLSNAVTIFIRDPAFYHRDFQMFYDNNPDIDFRQVGGDLALNKELFQNQGLDFAISPRNLRDQPEIAFEELYRDRFLLAVPKKHPLAKYEEVSFDQLRSEKFIGHSSTSFFQEQVDLLCKEHGFLPHYVMHCDYIMRAEMLAKGRGVAITTCHTSTTGYFDNAKFLTISELKAVPFIFYIYWEKNKPQSLVAQRFKHYLAQLYENFPQDIKT